MFRSLSFNPYPNILEELFQKYPGNEDWRRLRYADDLDEFKRWLKANDIPLPMVYWAVREAVHFEVEQGYNHPCILLEVRSLAKKYGFENDPAGFFKAAGEPVIK